MKKIIKLWRLTKKTDNVLDSLSLKDIKDLPEKDTKPVFLSDMTDEEYDEYVRKEVNGWKVFDEKLNKIINGKL